MKKILYLILFLCVLNRVNSSYITEINFDNEEFVELEWNESLPENFIIFDEGGLLKNNTATLYQKKTNSSLLLITGSKFKDKYKNKNLNCTIYLTDKTQFSYGGLKNEGESFQIRYKNKSIVYNSTQKFNFKTNESLNYIKEEEKYIIQKKSPCLIADTKDDKINDTQLKNTNQEIPECNEQFNILAKEIYENQIKFSFQTTATNYTIEYWVENYAGEIKKAKINTTNTKEKTYTPNEKTEIYSIKADLTYNNCTKHQEKIVSFFNNDTDKTNTKEIAKEKSKNSSIKILNEDEILNGNKKVELEIHRGETNKRTTYLYLNSVMLMSFELEKFTTLKTKITLSSLEEKNELYVEGLGLNKSLEFFLLDTKEKSNTENTNSKEETQQFNIEILETSNNETKFNISTNIENNSILCYILHKKTRISNTINTSVLKTSTRVLKINKTLLDERFKEMNTIELKLLCKYKPQKIKTFYSKSILFNLSKNQSEKINLTLNSTRIEETQTYNTSTLNSFNSLQKDSEKITKQPIENKTENFTSSQQKIKNNSLYFIFFGVTLVFLLMIWKF